MLWNSALEHAAAAQRLAVGFERFVDHREAIALAQRAAKVDIAREQICQLHGHAVGNVGIVGGGKQRAVDDAASQAARRCQWRCGDVRGKAVTAFFNHQALEQAVIVVRPAGGDAQQAVVIGGFGRNDALGASQQVALGVVSRRKKAAAAGSATPRRCSSDSGVSLARTWRSGAEKLGRSTNSAKDLPLASDSTGCSNRRTGKSAIKAKEATASTTATGQ